MLNYCARYISVYRHKLAVYLSMSIVSTIIAIIIPIFCGQIIDLMTSNQDVYRLIKMGILVLFLGFLNILIGYWNYRFYIVIQTNTAEDISEDIIHHLHKISLNELQKYDMGYLNESINNDSNSIVIFFLSLIVNALSNGLMLLSSLLILCTISLKVGAVLFLLICLYIIFFLGIRDKLLREAESYKDARSVFFSALLEQFGNIKFIKQQALEDYYKSKLKQEFKIFFEKALSVQQFFYRYSSADDILEIAVNFCIYVLGGISVVKGNMTIGGFTIILNFYKNIIASIKYFADLGKEYQDNNASYKRLQKYCELKEQKNGVQILEDISTISCNNLCFTRDGQRILQGLNITFEKGEIYCIHGENGSGKTTLIDLLSGLFIGEYEGEIYYNDINIENIDMREMRRRKISILEQEPYVLGGSLEDNICLSGKQLESKYFSRIIKKKIGTVGENGKGISGGEKQKIGILRVLAKQSDVLIFDEPTSALDQESKKDFFDLLKKIKKEKIIIFISHDKEAKQIADKVIEMSVENHD